MGKGWRGAVGLELAELYQTSPFYPSLSKKSKIEATTDLKGQSSLMASEGWNNISNQMQKLVKKREMR